MTANYIKLFRVTSSLLLFLLIPFIGYGYNRFEHLTVEDGLAHTDATSIIQDNSGLIWIGTNSGLQSFDGYSLQLYDFYKHSTSRIRKYHNRITSLSLEGKRLWVGTKSGLMCFCLTQHSYKPISYSPDNVLQTSDIKQVYTDRLNKLWIKTTNKIYYASFDVNTQTLIVHDSIATVFPKNGGNDIFSIQSSDKYIWLVSERNIIQAYTINDKIKFREIISQRSVLPDKQIINHAIFHNHALYLRTEEGCARIKTDKKSGYLQLSTKKYFRFADIIPGIPQRTNGKIIVDKNETLWVITQDGLLEINNAFTDVNGKLHRKVFSDYQSLSTNFLSSLFIDNNNNLWVGTWGGGVNFLSSNESFFKMIKYTPESNFTLVDQFVKAIEKDDDGTLWILTQKGGLNHYNINKGLIRSYNFSEIPITNKVFKDILLTPDKKSILIGSMDGLILFNKNTGKSTLLMGANSGLILKKNTHIYNLDSDRFGNIWVGTWDDGLYCLKNSAGKYSIIKHLSKGEKSNCISSNLITHIFCDSDKDEIMICTDNGLNRIIQDKDGNIRKIIKYKSDEKKSNSITSDFVSVIDKQNDSTYWIGTLGGGLNKFIIDGETDNYNAVSYLINDGISSDNVEIVLVDNQQNVWFSANGISKLDTKTNAISNFDYRDGLQGNSFKIGAGYKDKNGILYFGGIYGLNYFNPASIRVNKSSSNVILTNLFIHSKLFGAGDKNSGHIVLNKILNETEVLKLRHYENDFAISFTALNYWTSSKIRYRYRLIGLNDEWQYINGDQNKVYYSNLNFTDYLFEIQVSSNCGKTWNENSKTLKITVMPPWWLSVYAKIIYFILIIVIIITLFRFYNRELTMKHQLEIKELEEKNMEENHQLKLQFFMNISHEFKTPLTLILSSIERLSQINETEPGTKRFFETISINANKMLSLITELMDFRKTDIKKDKIHLCNENISEYIGQICNEFSTWANTKDIQLEYQSIPIEMYFDREKVAKIITNLLSNAIKYSDEHHRVEIIVTKGNVSEITPKYPDKYIVNNDSNNEECCLIIVRDEGIGISKESISQVFDRFFQIESKTSMHIGSGIGLAVAKNMVLSHRGSIIISSERNTGTEFVVAIPLNLKPDLNNPESNQSFDVLRYLEDQHIEYNYNTFSEDLSLVTVGSNEQEKPVLLIVEDNRELLLNLKQYFCEDYFILTAENGKEGLELCKENYPDLIVSDVMMPEMDGIQLCAAIRENLNIAYTPIILLTAKSEIEHQLEGYEAGADLYIPKPFSLKLLELNIRRLIFHKREMIKFNQTAENKMGEDGSILRYDIMDQKEKLFLEKLMTLINENLDNTEYSVVNICRELAVGRTKLYTKVKDITGQALGDLIRDIRLNKSAYLLRHTDMNITEVIYEVGFGSNSHFSKAFKARFGMTPSEYAKSAD